MEKIEKIFIGWAVLIFTSYLLVWVGSFGNGLFYSICGLVGIILQFPTSKIDLLLIYFKSDWLICIFGSLCFIIKIVKNNL